MLGRLEDLALPTLALLAVAYITAAWWRGRRVARALAANGARSDSPGRRHQQQKRGGKEEEGEKEAAPTVHSVTAWVVTPPTATVAGGAAEAAEGIGRGADADLPSSSLSSSRSQRRVFAGERVALLWCALCNSRLLVARCKAAHGEAGWRDAWLDLWVGVAPSPFQLDRALGLKRLRLIALSDSFAKPLGPGACFTGRCVPRADLLLAATDDEGGSSSSSSSSNRVLTDKEGLALLRSLARESDRSFREYKTPEPTVLAGSKDPKGPAAAAAADIAGEPAPAVEHTPPASTAPPAAPPTLSKAAHTYDKGYKKWESFDVESELAKIDQADDLADLETPAPAHAATAAATAAETATTAEPPYAASADATVDPDSDGLDIMDSLLDDVLGESSAGDEANQQSAPPATRAINDAATPDPTPVVPAAAGENDENDDSGDSDAILGAALDSDSDDGLDALLDSALDGDDSTEAISNLNQEGPAAAAAAGNLDMLDSMFSDDGDVGENAIVDPHAGLEGITDPEERSALSLLPTSAERLRWRAILNKDKVRQMALPGKPKPVSRLLESLHPPKVRKAAAASRPNFAEIDTNTVFDMVLGRAMMQAGCAKRGQPIQLEVHPEQLRALRAGYADVFREALRKRLIRDADFDKERFTAAAALL